METSDGDGDSNILLVESNELCEEVTLAALSGSGPRANITLLRDGGSLFDYFFAAGGRRGRMPDLILLEPVLPGLDGLKVLQLLHSTHRDEPWELPPIVVFTRRENPEAIAAAYRRGVQRFVTRPSSRCRYMDVVQSIVVYRLFVNVPLPKGPARARGNPCAQDRRRLTAFP